MKESRRPLSDIHSFSLKVDDDVTCFELMSESDCEHLELSGNQKDYYVLGEGTNTIFVRPFEGKIILNRIKGIDVTETSSDWLLSVGAGENWHDLVVYCTNRQMFGLENLALIPGTVGAAPVQNIGAYGVEFQQFCDWVRFWHIDDGCFHILSGDECKFSYRESIFKQELAGKVIITSVGLKLPKSWQPNVSYGELQQLKRKSASDILAKVIDIRNSKLPKVDEVPNAGSFFKNPLVSKKLLQELVEKWSDIPHFYTDNELVKLSAAWLIDKAGLKNVKVGDVGCYHKQPLVIVNHGNAKPSDLIEFARLVIDTVDKKFGVKLVPEVRVVAEKGLKEITELG